MGLIFATALMAQSAPKTVTINEADIQYWVGNGTNSTVIAIGWDATNASYTPTVVVWGIHWTGTITLLDALDTLVAYDSRFGYTISGSFLSSLTYNDPTAGVNLTPVQGYNCNNYNGVYGFTSLSTSTWLRISESTCDNYNFTGVNNLIYASNPNAGTGTLPDTVDASIPFSDILYWVGTGTDSAAFIVNFAQPDTAFAWGYLFNGSTTAQAMVNAIAAADPRFWVEGDPSVSGDLHFLLSNGDTMGLSPVDPAVGYNFWWTNLNGVSAGAGANSTLHNGDVFKYGDMNSATGWNYMYGFYLEEAWNTIPTPVPAPSDPAPIEATIDFSDIIYWVGTGSNEAVLAVNWADTALAWGYRWNGTATVEDMMDDIAAADQRFSYTGTGYVNDILFNDGAISLAGTPGNYWGSTNNGIMDMGLGQTLANGDLEKWGDPAAGVIVDSNNYGGPIWYYTYAYPMTIHPVSVPTSTPDTNLVDATIDASAIEYWVGEGESQAILAVNWPDTALAWGYRFTGDKTVSDMMNDIAAADPRFSIVLGGYGIDDILFVENGDTLRRLPTSYWGSTNNGIMDMGMGQPLANNDFEKWSESSTGVFVDSTWVEDWGGYWSYNYVYPMEIHAASQPLGAGPFCGIVGTEGCTAIPANSTAIKGWATACTVELGPQNISVEGSPLVSYHTAQDAVGPCTMNDNLSVVALGDGGSATVTFDLPIMNGAGPDFAVFENSFNDYFLELAFVEVSSDGERFVRFPATSLTQTVRQVVSSVDPTFINNLAGKYKMGYGTPFDLEELRDSAGIDINNITHVRVVDVVGSINPLYATYDAFGHMVNDPWPTNSYSSGFDLDGVAVINQNTNAIADADETHVSLYPNPTVGMLSVSVSSATTAQLYDFSGRLVAEPKLAAGSNNIDLSQLPAGVYMLRVDGVTKKVVKL